ncbi:MAG: hypothetical protein K9H25_06230 [Rhodospirillum sp.]|nr:hypothetical protein [Rhodospirillum sp.]MCF8489010.1 hypothetical protein [Rhodospirillum sp.]MCF8499951.1 hypothetical protein [Rhodospirillum sp.]
MAKWNKSGGLVFTITAVILAAVTAFFVWSLVHNGRIERIEILAAQFHEDLRPDPDDPKDTTDMICRILTWRFAKTHWFDVGDPIIPGIVEKHHDAGCDPGILDTVRRTHARLRGAR